ncbi:MAG: PorT family protein [Bacteroidetes bacterium]|nr:MAG: PorT family protein [Bacteroidota bacterium]TAG90648.1 MAG: PorT family protein [Bacteroidota bacterium]
MKKIFLILCLIGISGIYAQERFFEISPVIGINYAKTTGLRDGNRVILPNLGVRFSYRVTNNFLVSITPSFSQKGDKAPWRFYNFTTGGLDTRYETLTTTYIDFPITFQRNFNFKRFTIYPILGLQLGYMTGGKIQLPTGLESIYSVRSQNLIDASSNWGTQPSQIYPDFTIDRFDFGLTIGVGVSYKVSQNVRMFHEVRYTHAVNRFLSESAASSYYMMNNFFTLTNGVIFGAGKKRTLLGF